MNISIHWRQALYDAYRFRKSVVSGSQWFQEISGFKKSTVLGKGFGEEPFFRWKRVCPEGTAGKNGFSSWAYYPLTNYWEYSTM